MKILKDGKQIAEVDTEIPKVKTQSYPLRNLIQDRFRNGILTLWEGGLDEEENVYIDEVKRFFPRDGKDFWTALKEDLILEGYSIA